MVTPPDDLSPAPKVPNVLQTRGIVDLTVPILELHLEDGSILRVPTSSVTKEAGSHNELLSPAEMDVNALSIPIVEERLEVGKRVVTTGTVRLEKKVQEYETQLDETLAIRTFDIERIARNQVVEEAPGVRTEGDKTIYPVVEEQLVLTRQLVLKEEIHVTKRDSERHDTQAVILRREHVTVERSSADVTQTPSEATK